MTVNLINRKVEIQEEQTQENKQSKDKYIIDFKDDILKYKRIILNAPVGSGKSTFALEYLPKLGNTLIIVSRICIEDQFENIVVNYYTAHNITICTQWYVANNYIDTRLYDIIVVDESHFLISDTFATGAYHVGELLKRVSSKTTVILMSACAGRARTFIQEELGMYMQYINLDGKVHSVKPLRISTAKAKQAHQELDKADINFKIIYFCQAKKEVSRLTNIYQSKGIKCIGITSQSILTNNSGEASKEKEVYDYLIKESKFPDDIDVIFCTSKLREGININDPRVKVLITELKDKVSLIQCAGRIRHGVENMIVIYDKGNRTPFYTDKKIHDAYIRAEYYNNSLKGIPSDMSDEERTKIIDHMIDKSAEDFGGLIIFTDNKFIVYQGMVYEIKERCKEHAESKADLDKYVKDAVLCQDLDEIFHSIIKPYLDRRITKIERTDIVRSLNLMGWNCKHLPDILEEYGYDYENASNRDWYYISKKKCVWGSHPVFLIYPLFDTKRTVLSQSKN